MVRCNLRNSDSSLYFYSELQCMVWEWVFMMFASGTSWTLLFIFFHFSTNHLILFCLYLILFGHILCANFILGGSQTAQFYFFMYFSVVLSFLLFLTMVYCQNIELLLFVFPFCNSLKQRQTHKGSFYGCN